MGTLTYSPMQWVRSIKYHAWLYSAGHLYHFHCSVSQVISYVTTARVIRLKDCHACANRKADCSTQWSWHLISFAARTRRFFACGFADC